MTEDLLPDSGDHDGCTCPVELAGMAITSEKNCHRHGDRELRCSLLPPDHESWECERGKRVEL